MTVRIILRPIGLLREYVSEGIVELDPGGTLNDLVSGLGIPDRFSLIAILNGQQVNPMQMLQDKDEVKIFTMVSGG